jgi:glyoxylase-like metal-dependent hydrolase (beta-lactamase superfamily II)
VTFTEPIPGVLRFEDTCVVYAVRCPDDPSAAVLIDLGSGDVLDQLAEAGIDTVRWVLHTHHHRDVCQGDERAAGRGIPIAVPATERHYFERAEDFWENRQLLHLYDTRNDYNTLTASVPVAADLVDGEVFDAGGIQFEVVPTPGHTKGSITLLTTIEDRIVAFSGDLVHAGGTVATLYDLQYGYGSFDGLDLARASMLRLRKRRPEVLLPSEGAVIEDADGVLALAEQRLGRYWDYTGRTEPRRAPSVVSATFKHLTPHILECTNSVANFFVLLSESGAAAFFDYGHMSPAVFNHLSSHNRRGERSRFIPHAIDELRDLGVREIEVAIPTHMHDDHLIGMPWLRRTFGTEVWAYENMPDVLGEPGKYLLGCTNAEPVPVDRVMRHGERVRWREFELDVVHGPGHTEYQSAIVVEDDGVRVAFTGDNYFQFPGLQPGDIHHNVIFRNEIEADSHLRALDYLMPLRPDVIAPGHGGSFRITPEQLQRHRVRLEEQVEIWSELVDGPVDYAVNPRWVSLVPYTNPAVPGGEFGIELRVRNYTSSPQRLGASLALPAGWSAAPEWVEADAEVGKDAVLPFRVRVAPDASVDARRAIAADLTIDGRRRGQLAEAVVDITAGER